MRENIEDASMKQRRGAWDLVPGEGKSPYGVVLFTPGKSSVCLKCRTAPGAQCVPSTGWAELQDNTPHQLGCSGGGGMAGAADRLC